MTCRAMKFMAKDVMPFPHSMSCHEICSVMGGGMETLHAEFFGILFRVS
jgi:hypothetical protein